MDALLDLLRGPTAPWWSPVLAGLLGALIGGAATLAGGAIQRASENRNKRADKIADVARHCYDNAALRQQTQLDAAEIKGRLDASRAALSQIEAEATALRSEQISLGTNLPSAQGLTDYEPTSEGNRLAAFSRSRFIDGKLGHLEAARASALQDFDAAIAEGPAVETKLIEVKDMAMSSIFMAEMYLSKEAREIMYSMLEDSTIDTLEQFTKKMREVVHRTRRPLILRWVPTRLYEILEP